MTANHIYVGIDPAADGIAAAAIDEKSLLQVGVFNAVGQNGVDAISQLISKGNFLQRFLQQLPLTDHRLIAAVEDQEIVYTSKQGANPRDLLNLTKLAGAAMAVLASYKYHAVIFNPLPAQWKGQQPKRINQARSFAKLGIAFEQTKNKDENKRYCVPLDPVPVVGRPLLKTDWRDVGDAVGQALWARERWKYMMAKQEMAVTT